jgi:HPt (histidine-containing phosphotransfer) domain-containing protein
MNATLRSVWVEHESLVLERVGIVERAVERLIAGDLSKEERARARGAAHMLAGSVGMFGYADSSEAAHLLEVALERGEKPEASEALFLREQLERMRAEGLEPPRA